MKITHLFMCVCALSVATVARATSYGDTMLAATAARHPGVTAISVRADGTTGPIEVTWGRASRMSPALPLTDALGKPIGTVAFGFRRHSHDETGSAIAAEMARRIYVADNLGEPDPYVPGKIRFPGAQALVDHAIDINPDLLTLAMHVTPPGETTNTIIASNFGRIGKLADKDDTQVVEGAIRKEITNNGSRIAVELPLKDAAGRTIGALSTSFVLASEQDPDDGVARALAVRDALAKSITDLASLARLT